MVGWFVGLVADRILACSVRRVWGFALLLCRGLIASSGTARARGSTRAAGTGFEAAASTRAALSATP